jgi:hypothetical protein
MVRIATVCRKTYKQLTHHGPGALLPNWCKHSHNQDLDALEIFAGMGALTSAFLARGRRATCVDIEYMIGNADGFGHAMDICTPAGFASVASDVLGNTCKDVTAYSVVQRSLPPPPHTHEKTYVAGCAWPFFSESNLAATCTWRQCVVLGYLSTGPRHAELLPTRLGIQQRDTLEQAINKLLVAAPWH